jgi:uncharacterized protein (DUF1778 family)
MQPSKRESYLRARVRFREEELIRAAARAGDVTVSEVIRAGAIAEAKRVLASVPS